MSQATSVRVRTGKTAVAPQPIALAAGALLAVVFGVGIVGVWRAYSGNSPEQERVATAHHLEAQASEPPIETERALQVTQQDTIDALQMLQDQLHTVRRLLAAQQAEVKRLADEVSRLRETIDGLRQSFASAPTSDIPTGAGARTRSIQTRFPSK